MRKQIRNSQFIQKTLIYTLILCINEYFLHFESALTRKTLYTKV